MTDEAATGSVILFGGEASHGALGGTWAWGLPRRGDRELCNRASRRAEGQLRPPL